MNNYLKGLLHGVGFWLVAGGVSLVGLVPQNISSMTVEAVIVAVIGFVGHYLSTV